MHEELGKLAERFRQALEAREAARRRDEEERRVRAEDARRARTELLAELAAFGEAVGLSGEPRGEGLAWRWEERTVTFRPVDDALEVAWKEQTPRTARLYREQRIGNRWVLAVQAPAEEKLPLIDVGLVRLLVQGLGLPEPVGDVRG